MLWVEQIGFLVGSVTDELINVEESTEGEREEPDTALFICPVLTISPPTSLA